MNEWSNIGMLPVVIYGEKGTLIKVRNIESLGLNNETDKRHIEQTVSSYLWDDDSIVFFWP